MALALGHLEAQAIAYVQAAKLDSIQTGTLSKELGWTNEQERKVLSRLARKGLIARVRRGLYLIPPRLPQGGKWSPGEFLAITALIADRGGSYRISGPSTFHRYGWTDQIPNRVYVYNNRISGDRQIGPVQLTLIKVADKRLGGTETVHTPEAIEVLYASKARTLLDAVHDWSRFDSLPRAFGWIRTEVEREDGFAADLVQTTIKYGNQATIRRIGAFLEKVAVQDNLLRKLERELRPSSSFIPWIPNRKKRGTLSKRWGVVFNDE